MHGWRIVAFLAWGCSSQLCLPHGVPKENRSYIKDEFGNYANITLLAGKSEHAEVFTLGAKILIEEVLGYHAVIADVRPVSVVDAALELAGCSDAECSQTHAAIGHAALSVHNWDSAYLQAFRLNNPSRAPDSFGFFRSLRQASPVRPTEASSGSL